ncbi:hypothetical protein K9N08_04410 [Candidatus Gracilibacteria bacterium]|nr:hypothetical protein [Candidatus Gracilibacteria bacterium]MCF7856755.1 hypothetical protein [Candidatus Gracilibacteria bacterium]MCF7897039.1 hypothetical protein [Candidatus Gracilibacteria bacterium]
MKVAVASENKTAGSLVSDEGGRAPFYLIFENGELVKILKNPFRVGGGGAGFAVAELLADEKVEFVVAGKIGGNMDGALDAKKIEHSEISGISVAEAIQKI